VTGIVEKCYQDSFSEIDLVTASPRTLKAAEIKFRRALKEKSEEVQAHGETYITFR
jgi:Holliday junction resolvase-like predicted endonuclease